MALRFCRSYPWQTELSNKARFFVLKLGFAGEVDPESGMSIDLVKLDEKARAAMNSASRACANENDLLHELAKRLSAEFSQKLELLEIEETVSLRAWGIKPTDWLEKKIWVTLREEKKVFLLRLRSSKELSLARIEYQSWADLRRQLDGFSDRLTDWDLTEPVSGLVRGK